MQPLSDAQKLEAVQLRARHRGFEMPEDVARYILSRYPRDLVSLFDLLDRIDEASLAQQRRVTIPFLRELEAMLYEDAGIGNKS
jgi:DnaA family protein